MQGRTDLRGQKKMAPPPAPPAKREENSGLHEIRELARSTKRRISNQHAAVESDDALLRTSSSSLSTVALPDPSKESATDVHFPVPDAPAAVPAAATAAMPAEQGAPVSASPVPGTPPRKGGLGVILMLVVVCAGAGVGLYLWKGQTGGEATPTAAKAATPPAQSAGATAEPLDEMAPTAVDREDEETEEELADDEAELELAAADDEAEETASEADDSEDSDGDKDSRRAKRDKKSKRDKKAAAASASDDDKKKSSSDRQESKSEDDAIAKAKKSKSPSGDGSLDDVLSSVTGGIDDEPAEVDDKPKGPSRERLDRSDVAKAMNEVRGLAKSCYSVEEYTGSVTIKFTVAPSGKISKSSATGAHKSSPTGKCVLKAVRQATFPAFNGRPTSFSFPFLLAP